MLSKDQTTTSAFSTNDFETLTGDEMYQVAGGFDSMDSIQNGDSCSTFSSCHADGVTDSD